MKTWEALKAADEGKKIRRSFWGEGMYGFKDGERFGYCKSMLVIHYPSEDYDEGFGDLGWDDIFTNDWEIYEEAIKK